MGESKREFNVFANAKEQVSKRDEIEEFDKIENAADFKRLFKLANEKGYTDYTQIRLKSCIDRNGKRKNADKVRNFKYYKDKYEQFMNQKESQPININTTNEKKTLEQIPKLEKIRTKKQFTSLQTQNEKKLLNVNTSNKVKKEDLLE